MTRLFSNRVTESGRQAIQDLIDHVAQELNQTIETEGEGGIEPQGIDAVAQLRQSNTTA